mmetsp:Transcript_33009/g.29262  ORF Transcript_33009/g.29262 Transcript_33009/m.29262 type:complete len:86 (+) Transcript_33009:65-322(+)
MDNWKDVKVGKEVKISIHEHVLKAHEDTSNDEWCCNGIELFQTGCKAGITDFHQTAGVQGYSCDFVDTCDFDLCKECVKFSVWTD